MGNPSADVLGSGFAWFRQHAGRSWVINLHDYGAFTFEGSEAEAEEMRIHKARWEGEIAHKRPASATDYPRASHCWNHRGYIQTRRLVSRGARGQLLKRPFAARYYCDCGRCL